ncbi:MAG: hypothetical protein EOP11_02130, partial [Proteobacteria bacterium]
MDIIQELNADHAAIRAIILELRSDSTSPEVRADKLQKLGSWLRAHGDGEDRTIDAAAKTLGGELRTLGREDDEEHDAINRLHAKLARTTNPQFRQARLRLLCELLSHHLKEEEEEFFPLLKRSLGPAEREKLGVRYRELTREIDRLRPEVAGSVLGWLTGRPDPNA